MPRRTARDKRPIIRFMREAYIQSRRYGHSAILRRQSPLPKVPNMRLRFAEVIFCLGLLFTADLSLAAPSWAPIGIDGGVVYGLAVDPTTPTTLFAATLAGAFRSTDGLHWTKVFHLECA